MNAEEVPQSAPTKEEEHLDLLTIHFYETKLKPKRSNQVASSRFGKRPPGGTRAQRLMAVTSVFITVSAALASIRAAVLTLRGQSNVLSDSNCLQLRLNRNQGIRSSASAYAG